MSCRGPDSGLYSKVLDAIETEKISVAPPVVCVKKFYRTFEIQVVLKISEMNQSRLYDFHLNLLSL